MPHDNKLPTQKSSLKKPTHIKKNCKACFNIIDVRLADHKRGWGNFCDKACSAAYKCGHRPHDVNQGHRKYSLWADTQMFVFEKLYGVGNKPPKAPTIEEQLGEKIKVKKIKRKKPRDKRLTNKRCVDCGAPSGSYRKCIHHQSIDDMDGWDYKDNIGAST